MRYFIGFCKSSGMAVLLLMVVLSCSDDEKDNGVRPDTIPPSVVSTVPTDGATNIPVTSAISATFSEDMNPSTIAASTFTVSGVMGAVTYGDKTATFTPEDTLYSNTAYTVTITTGVTDKAGNNLKEAFSWSFTTVGQPDDIPPQVIGVSPEDGALDVPPNTVISATFSEPIDASTLDNSSFLVSNGVTGTINYSDKTAVFTPDGDLQFGTTFLVTLTQSVTDTAGNPLQPDYSWSFTTQPAALDSQFVEEASENLFVPVPETFFISAALFDSIVDKNPGKGFSSYPSHDIEVIITGISSYAFTDFWHVFNFEAEIYYTSSGETYDAMGVDSLQILVNGTPAEYPSDIAEENEFKFHAHYVIEPRLYTASMNVHHQLEVALYDIEDFSMMIGGSCTDTMNVQSSSGEVDCSAYQTAQVEFEAIFEVLDFYITCYENGYLSARNFVDYVCIDNSDPSDTVIQMMGVWWFDIVYNGDGTMTITYTNGVDTWTVMRSCGGKAVAPRRLNIGKF